MTTVAAIDDLPSLVDTTLKRSAWTTVTQDRIDLFADATDDHQWIHVDAELAAAGPFGATVAHGYLTLSMLAPLILSVLDVTGTTAVVNYGLNKVRFPSPVKVGSRIRLAATVAAVEQVAGGAQITFVAVIEVDGAAKPACVAEPVLRYYG